MQDRGFFIFSKNDVDLHQLTKLTRRQFKNTLFVLFIVEYISSEVSLL